MKQIGVLIGSSSMVRGYWRSRQKEIFRTFGSNPALQISFINRGEYFRRGSGARSALRKAGSPAAKHL